MKRAGIFGGSFDPVHYGHLRIARSFLECGLIDKLLVIPSPSPPHKTRKEILPFTDRFKMLQIAFNGWENVEISDIEWQLSNLPDENIRETETGNKRLSLKPSYSVETVAYLQQQFPETLWFLCIGEDSLVQFHEWYQYEKILEMVTLLVAERPGFDSGEIDPQILERTIFIEHEPVDISSTEFRRLTDEMLIPENVLIYIKKNRLYGQGNRSVN